MNLKRTIAIASALCIGIVTLFFPAVMQDTILTCFAAEEIYGDFLIFKNENAVTISEYIGTEKVVEIPREIYGLPVTKIGTNFCKSNKEFTDIIIPDSVNTIELHSFQYQHGLTSITIPSSVSTIGSYAFEASSLKEVNFEGTVAEIGDCAFAETPFYREILSNIKNNIIGYAGHLFKYSQSTEDTKIAIDNSINMIADYAFSEWYQLKEVTFSDSVKFIGKGAFYRCLGLEKITILNPKCEIREIFSNYMSTCDYSGIICGYENSTAQAYAEKYGYIFEVIDSEPKEIIEETTEQIETTEIKNTLPVEPAEDMVWNGVNPDITRDGKIDASDGAVLLTYAAEFGAGKVSNFKEFMDKNYS